MDVPYDVEFEHEDDDFQSGQGFEAPKEHLIFLIDAQSGMLEKCNLKEFPNETYLEVAVKQATEVLRHRIIASSNDEIAVVFYGTREKTKTFDHVYTFLDLDVPDAGRIQSLSKLDAEKFERDIGVSSDKSPLANLKLALWTCSSIFSTSKAKKASRRVLLFTNCEDPSSGGQRAKDVIKSRAETLHDSGASLQLFPIIAASQPFDVTLFWSEILEVLKDENEGSGPINVVAQMQQLIETVKRRNYKKRAFRALTWTLGPGVELAVQMFNMVQPATKGSAVWLDAKTNEPLRSETAYICNDTGSLLTVIDKKFYEVKSGDKSRFPKVVMLNDELVKVKSVKPLGLKLLGFKPRRCLQDYHQTRSTHFIYPAEHHIKGSTLLFNTLLQEMLGQNQIAICSYVSRMDAMPLLVALLPQGEELDAVTQYQLSPPGMHMVYLPYADDLRYPETEPSLVGITAHKVEDSQVAAAERLIDSMTLYAEFNTANDVLNPHIQRHYKVLEALALDEEVQKEVEDQTLPDPDILAREEIVQEVQKFKDATVGTTATAGGGKAGGKGTKRKAEDAPAPEYGQYNWKQLAGAVALEKLKVDELKLYLQHHRLNLSGRKAELVDRIRKHLKVDGPN